MLRKCALLGSLIGLFIGSAFADSKARIVRISFAEGEVELDRADGRGYIRAFANMPVIEGVRLWTRAGGRAEVEFEDGGTLRLAPDSLVEFTELRLGERGEKVTRMDLEQGTFYANLKEHDQDRLALTLARQELRLGKSSRFRAHADPNNLGVAVFRGEVELLRQSGQLVKVRKNETLRLEADDEDRYYLSKGIVEDAHDYWDREREEQRVIAQDRRQSKVVSASYDPSYDDLSRYGQWVHHRDYGWIWRPFHVDIHWDPFGQGAWVWYPHRGYIWVSSYPWGWTPYHYGSWVYVGGTGWCWRGGPRVTVTNANVNIINPPPNYHVPRPQVADRTTTTVAVVNNGNVRPADPRGEWLPRAEGHPAVTENEPRVLRGGRNDADRATDAPAATVTRSANPDVRSEASVSRNDEAAGPRREVRDRDYEGVDYRRRTTPAPVATVDRADADNAVRSQRTARSAAEEGPRPATRVYRDDGERDVPAAITRSAPPISTRPADEPRVSPRQETAPRVEPRVERPEPRVERPAPAPRIERSAPEPRIERSAPAPVYRAPSPAPSTAPQAAPQPRPSAPTVSRTGARDQ